MENLKLVNVYTLNNPSLAHIIHGMLQAEGIPCHVENASQGGLTGILDVRVLVRAVDADRAQKLIETHLRPPPDADDV